MKQGMKLSQEDEISHCFSAVSFAPLFDLPEPKDWPSVNDQRIILACTDIYPPTLYPIFDLVLIRLDTQNNSIPKKSAKYFLWRHLSLSGSTYSQQTHENRVKHVLLFRDELQLRRQCLWSSGVSVPTQGASTGVREVWSDAH